MPNARACRPWVSIRATPCRSRSASMRSRPCSAALRQATRLDDADTPARVLTGGRVRRGHTIRVDDLVATVARLQFPPHLADAGAMPLVGEQADIVEGDEPVRADEVAVDLEVGHAPLVRMVAVDEQQVDRLPGEYLLQP